MDSEQKIRVLYILSSVVIALSLVYVIYAFMERPWHDNEEMIVFMKYRGVIDKIITNDLIVCDAKVFEKTQGLRLVNPTLLNNSTK
jgi:hypothetical protein